MNLEQRCITWDATKKTTHLRSIIKRGFCPIYGLSARYGQPMKLAKAQRHFEAFCFGLDFVNRVADRSEALAPRNPVIIGTVDNPDAVTLLKFWIDVAVPRFDEKHLTSLPADLFAEFTGCEVEFRRVNGASKKFHIAIAKAEHMDCFLLYPSQKPKPNSANGG